MDKRPELSFRCPGTPALPLRFHPFSFARYKHFYRCSSTRLLLLSSSRATSFLHPCKLNKKHLCAHGAPVSRALALRTFIKTICLINAFYKSIYPRQDQEDDESSVRISNNSETQQRAEGNSSAHKIAITRFKSYFNTQLSMLIP